MQDRLAELWRISRTALAATQYTRFDRLQYVTNEYCREFPDAKRKTVWLAIDIMTRGYGN